ncbi:putative selenate ABC transporter substrate-binding protein [Leptolyngbya sp. AN02str]|uniref:putative selenate ABC transporter substrate-binding protein n=1 Tax=Leptolyngbya sp. AN02str TaxID=3423363 RepID=UPI003D31719D
MLKRLLFPFVLSALLPLAACAPSADLASNGTTATQPLVTGAIPDQDPEKLQRLYGILSDYLSQELGVPVEYKPVTDYTAAVTAFKVGDLDLVWFGGLTGVQARLQVPGAAAIAQRDIDAEFHSVFIANTASGLDPFEDASGLQNLKGKTFTFGSESSTSGRLMPQHFLQEAGVSINDFRGEVGFSQNHDATIKLVEAGTYEVGVLNEQVWQKRSEAGEVDLNKVRVVWRTPAYYDYHWVVNPQVDERYGEGFADKVQAALLKLDPSVPEHQEILDLFGASKFIETENSNYSQIEAVGRQIGKIQ